MNPDKAAIDALHAAAIAIAQAKANGDAQAEALARADFNRIAALYGGFTQSQLDTALAQAQADSDPFGIKTAGKGLALVAIVGALFWISSKGKSRRREW
jgi:multidrug efflux pump subunit AcrA (membrane-fusion protein)